MSRVPFRTQTFPRVAAIGLVLALLAAGLLQPNAASAADFAPGDVLEVDTPALNVRAGSGTGNSVVAVLPGDAQVTIVAGPVAANGYTWYEIASPSGWLIGEGLAPGGTGDPGDPGENPGGGDYPPGRAIIVATDALNLRSGPSLQTTVINVLPYGTEAYVVSGPYIRDGYAWYEITAAGQSGFAVSDFLASGGAGGALPPGDTATVATDALNVRVNVGLGASVVAVLPWGTAVSILAGPIDAEGYTWYRIASAAGNGWVAGEFLSFDRGSGGGAPGGVTVGGTAVVSDGPVNLRQTAGTGGAIITALPIGTALTVTDGPVTANGYTWVYVSASGSGSGWAAAEFLRAT